MSAVALALVMSAVAHGAVNRVPVVTVPADFSVEGDTVGGWLSWYAPTAKDPEDGPLPTACAPASGAVLPLGTTTVTCSATDSAGETGYGSFVVTVDDTVAPMLTGVPALIWMETPDPTGDIVGWPAPWAIDTVDGLVPVICDPASETHFNLGATPVTCSTSDLTGNVETSSFMAYLTLVDSTPPVMSDVPADISVDATDPYGTTVSWPSPTAVDNIDGSVPVVCAPASGSFFAGGTTTVTCTATDAHGNAATGTFSVNVTVPIPDTTPPVLGGLPTGISVDTTDPAGIVVTWDEPWANDDVDGLLPVNCTPASGSTFEVGATTVECSATDSSGNDGTAEPFVVQVTLIDETPPVISGVPAGVAEDTYDPSGAVVNWTAPSALDNIDGVVPVACAPASGSLFHVGSTTVTCSAVDAAGNSASDSFTVRVTLRIVPDTTPPTLSGVPAGISEDTFDPTGAVVGWTSPSATDARDGTVPVACVPASGSLFPVGTTTVRCTATDAAGNVASDSFTVRVTLTIVPDTTPPTLSGVPSAIAVDTTNPAGRTVTWSAPSASDAVDGTVPVACVPASGSLFPVGTTTVRCTATDAADNVASDSFTVRVTLTIVPDTTPPTLSGVPADMSVVVSALARMAVTWPMPSAVDDVDGPVPVSCNPASGSAFPVGATTVMCRAVDAAGNVATGSFKVTVTEAAPDPGPVAGLDVVWGKPIGTSHLYKTRIGSKIELKARISLDGVSIPKKKAGTPTLVIERLTACGGTVVGRRDGGKLKWDDGAWRLDLKTSKLGVGCWRISVALGTAEGGAFELKVEKARDPKHDHDKGDRGYGDHDDGGDHED